MHRTLMPGKSLLSENSGCVEPLHDGDYRGAMVLRCVSIFGGRKTGHLHPDVLLYLNLRGEIYINPAAPECIKRIFRQESIRI